MKKYVLVLLLIALLSVGVVSAQDAPFKVALVLPSTITDLSWSQAMYQGFVAIQEEMGGESALEIAYTENMFDVTAAEQALRDYADEGYNLIVAHGTQYQAQLFAVAADYPETSFAWGTANDTGEDEGLTNVFAYQAKAEEGAYVEGVMAAMMSESGIIGIIGPIPAGDALFFDSGFQQGVMATDPDAQVLIAYTGGFGMTTEATQIAQSQIAAGADVLTGSSQQVVGAIDALSNTGGLWFATQWDQSEQWPDTVVVSQVYDWKPSLEDMIAKIQAGELGGTVYTLTLENGGQVFVYGQVEVSDEVKAAADEAIAAIIAGDIVVNPTMEEAEATPEATEAAA
jgi:basic membrane protein A